MSDFEIDIQNKIPILVLNTTCKHPPNFAELEKYFINDTEELNRIIFDLSNCHRIDADFFAHLNDFISSFKDTFTENSGKLGIVIPNEVDIEGLKIKLIDDSFEVYSSKYDAVYNLVNKTIQ
jgi:hypothetical protein